MAQDAIVVAFLVQGLEFFFTVHRLRVGALYIVSDKPIDYTQLWQVKQNRAHQLIGKARTKVASQFTSLRKM